MRHRSSASELFAWMLVGTAVGVAAGFALGEWLGPFTRRPPAGRTPGASSALRHANRKTRPPKRAAAKSQTR